MLVNRTPFGFFQSSRYLKHGEPLSPTLFLIEAKVLTRFLNGLYEDARFKGFGFPKWSPQINHLSYIDDTILFCSGHPKSMMMYVLRRYERVSGQMINIDKSICYLHGKVPTTVCK